MEDLYDQEDRSYRDRWRDALYMPVSERALTNEEILRWEHELGQPDYYDYFLEEVTR